MQLMPLMFWGDPDFAPDTDSYSDLYPGICCHGDRVNFNDYGGSFVLDRSDATLNRFGVGIGSAENCRTIEGLPEIAESPILCIEEDGGGYYMPLFVQMADDAPPSGDLTEETARR